MIRRSVPALIALTLVSVAAIANGSETDPAVEAMLRPGAGRVPFSIRVTQPRRVMVRTPGLTNGNASWTYACTTPCRLYVQPGDIDVTLVGWGAHQYHWNVPAQGGSVHLAARTQDGRLVLPSETAIARSEETTASF